MRTWSAGSHLNQRIRVLAADPAVAPESRLPLPFSAAAQATQDSRLFPGGSRAQLGTVWRAGPAFPVTAQPGRSLPRRRDHFLSVRAEAAGAALPSARGRGGVSRKRARTGGRVAAEGRGARAALASTSFLDALLGAAAPRRAGLGRRCARPWSLVPPRRALRWACPGGGRRAPSSAAPGALRTRRSRARWQHVCGVRSPEAAGQGGDHARRHPEGEFGEAPERGPRRGGVGRGSGPAVVRAGAGKPAEPFGACSARTKAPATAARFPRGARVLGGAARGREWGGPRESAVAPPRRDPTRGSRSLEYCAANSSELRPSLENLGTFRRGSGQARKEPVGTGVPQRSTRDPMPSAPDRCA